MNVAVALDDVGKDVLPSASEAGPAPKRIVVAYGFWIFLLSDIVMFGALCRLRGARASHCGRSDRRAAIQPGQRRDRDRLSSCLELHMRTDVAGDQFAAPNRHILFCSSHLCARSSFRGSRVPRVRRHDWARCNPAEQRIPLRVLRACRLPWASRYRRTDLVGSDDGSGSN